MVLAVYGGLVLPIDPDATAETRALLHHLRSLEGFQVAKEGAGLRGGVGIDRKHKSTVDGQHHRRGPGSHGEQCSGPRRPRGRFASTSWHQPIGPRSSRRTCTRRASAAAQQRSSVCETGPVPLPPRPGGVPGRDRGGRRLLPGVPRRLPQVGPQRRTTAVVRVRCSARPEHLRRQARRSVCLGRFELQTPGLASTTLRPGPAPPHLESMLDTAGM